uniref:Solute carrier family 13 member 2 n=1 Tax=Salarias fasciatus TaxID=181472 RepID=A0A672JGW2_SALFA
MFYRTQNTHQDCFPCRLRSRALNECVKLNSGGVCSQEAKCGFAIILMALYWCTECIPLAMTALLPVVLFPMLGIMEASEVCVQYLKDSNMLFFGGLLVAIAVEHWNLHKRIALQVLLIVGVKPSLLMIGFMSTTAFLSMWISNTASTAMMLPIANAVLQQLCDTEARAEEREMGLRAAKDGQDNETFEMNEKKEAVCDRSPEAELRRLKREQKYEKLSKGMSLSVCYSASIGGTATLTGTTPNVILKGQIDEYDNKRAMTTVLNCCLMVLWVFSLKKSFGCGTKKETDQEAFQVIKDEYKKLGRMTFAEACVLTIFTLLVLLWFTREPGFIPGWATVLFNKDKEFVTDGTVAILIVSAFFFFSLLCLFIPLDDDFSTLLNWDIVHEKMPWNILLLLGGGFALAHGSEVSGLSIWLGECLIPLQSIPPFAISILLCLLVAMFTECSSNTATTTLFLPILAIAIQIHPMYVMLPCTIAASLAFMLPVATPPNAIAFSYGNLKVIDMAKAGFVLNFVGVLIINLAVNTWGAAMFDLNTFPSWANITKTP